MASDLIQSAYRRTWWALVLRGIFGIALGAIILWRPIESIASFALVIAIWAFFSGVVQIVHAIDLLSLLLVEVRSVIRDHQLERSRQVPHDYVHP